MIVMKPEFLTTWQAAELLGVSGKTVRRMIAAGDLPAVNVARGGTSTGRGARWRIPAEVVTRHSK